MDDSVWKRLREELSSPWDWVAAGLGATVGLGASIAMSGVDAGTSAGVGAIGAVTVKKAGAAAFRKRQLRRRANQLLNLLGKSSATPDAESNIVKLPNKPKIGRIYGGLQRDVELWELEIINDDQFQDLLDQHIADYRS